MTPISQNELLRTCSTCFTTDSKYWRGFRVGKIVCQRCYVKQRNKISAHKKRIRGAMYSMWGDI